MPEIKVTINDSVKASFIIDTGADHIYIDKDFAEKNGLLSGGKMPMRPTSGVEGKFESFQIFLRGLSVGETKQSVVSAVTIDLRAVVKDTSKGLPDGVLGYSFLKSQKVLFDYKDSTFEMFETDYNSEKWDARQLAVVIDRHLITINATVNDSIDAKMIFDTGASKTVFSPALANVLKKTDTLAVAKIRLDKKFNVQGVPYITRDISTVSSQLKNSNIDGILGTTSLAGKKFLIDYRNSQILLIAN